MKGEKKEEKRYFAVEEFHERDIEMYSAVQESEALDVRIPENVSTRLRVWVNFIKLIQ